MRHLLKSVISKNSTISSCAKQIDYDIKHGVTIEEVLAVMQRIRYDKSFSEVRGNPETVQRLDDLERQISAPKKVASW
jgi:hypothetical protein